jgi:integrase
MRQCDVNMRQFRVKNYKWAKRQYVVEGRESGKRSRRFFDTKVEADSYASQKNIELKNEGRAHAEFPSRLRVMAQECTDKLSEFGKTIDDATRFYLRHLKASERSCTVAALVDELLKAKKADGASARYVADLGYRLSHFASTFGEETVSTITSAQIDDWLRALNLSLISRNNYRRVVLTMFGFAVQRGYAIDNPAERTAKAKVVGDAPGILTVQQTANLLVVASPESLPYVAIGAFAGLRRAELQRLDWSDVHFPDNLIEVTAKNAKAARRRFVKIQPNLREWLIPVRKNSGKVAPDDFRRQFDAARVAAGIVEWPDNALRHSFASYHLAKFRNQNALALEMGHTNSNMIFEHYRQLVKPKDAERYWNIRPAAKGKIVQLASIPTAKQI